MWASIPLNNKEFRAIARKKIMTEAMFAVKFSSLVFNNDLLSPFKKKKPQKQTKKQQQMSEGIALVCGLILATSLELISIFTQYLQRGKGCH